MGVGQGAPRGLPSFLGVLKSFAPATAGLVRKSVESAVLRRGDMGLGALPASAGVVRGSQAGARGGQASGEDSSAAPPAVRRRRGFPVRFSAVSVLFLFFWKSLFFIFRDTWTRVAKFSEWYTPVVSNEIGG